jgi:hypothetical protein
VVAHEPLKRFNSFYRDKDGWTKLRRPEVEHLSSRIYFDYKELSDLYETASNRNFKTELDEASHGFIYRHHIPKYVSVGIEREGRRRHRSSRKDVHRL